MRTHTGTYFPFMIVSSTYGTSYSVGDLPVPKRRKVIPTLSFEELLAQDIERADLKRKERSSERMLELGVIPITTQINPSFLAAGLKRRLVDNISCANMQDSVLSEAALG